MVNSNPKATAQSSEYHIPVLLRESVEALRIKPDGVYVDCTFGGGGHSTAILKALGPAGKLIAFDQDADAAQNLPEDNRVIFVPQNFRYLQRFLKLHKYPKVDGILADLGVSSHQFDEPQRGFSIRFDAPLDMRMDQRRDLTAADILEQSDEKRLHKMFEQYGEVSNSKTLAKAIVALQGTGRLKTIGAFKEAIAPLVKGNPHKYFAQVFQALRIEVNEELPALHEWLEQLPECLKTGGRVAVITFHSLEDRAVKNFFKSGSLKEQASDPLFGQKPLKPLEIITKKPILPSETEIKTNPRSRSAKLRVAEKL
jgi:16S rRNA (cytosine1402-N4)-methyltransferase